MSGFIPSIVALIQGVGEEKNCNDDNNNNITELLVNRSETIKANVTVIEPRFSVEVFFSSLLFTLLISWIAFILLQFLPICKKEMRKLNKHSLKNTEELRKFSVQESEVEENTESVESYESVDDEVSQQNWIFVKDIKVYVNEICQRPNFFVSINSWYQKTLIFICYV